MARSFDQKPQTVIASLNQGVHLRTTLGLDTNLAERDSADQCLRSRRRAGATKPGTGKGEPEWWGEIGLRRRAGIDLDGPRYQRCPCCEGPRTFDRDRRVCCRCQWHYKMPAPRDEMQTKVKVAILQLLPDGCDPELAAVLRANSDGRIGLHWLAALVHCRPSSIMTRLEAYLASVRDEFGTVRIVPGKPGDKKRVTTYLDLSGVLPTIKNGARKKARRIERGTSGTYRAIQQEIPRVNPSTKETQNPQTQVTHRRQAHQSHVIRALRGVCEQQNAQEILGDVPRPIITVAPTPESSITRDPEPVFVPTGHMRPGPGICNNCGGKPCTTMRECQLAYALRGGPNPALWGHREPAKVVRITPGVCAGCHSTPCRCSANYRANIRRGLERRAGCFDDDTPETKAAKVETYENQKAHEEYLSYWGKDATFKPNPFAVDKARRQANTDALYDTLAAVPPQEPGRVEATADDWARAKTDDIDLDALVAQYRLMASPACGTT